MKKLTIAVDGHSSCGKSTLAKALAKKLGYIYIDSGAMYRAVTLFSMKNNIIKSAENIDLEKLQQLLPDISIKLTYNSETRVAETFLNNVNVEKEIRTIEVSNLVSPISTIRFVRQRMVQLQQEMGKEGGIIMDGRDIGTVVFPHAELKLFMTASSQVRAMRRYKELQAKGENVSFEDVLKNVETRDHIDSTREADPLKKADDAIILDNSELDEVQQLNWVLKLIEEKFGTMV